MERSDEKLIVSELRNRVSSKTFSWLQAADNEEVKLQSEIEDDEAANAAALFGQLLNENEEEDDDSVYHRVQEWCSSLSNPDGFGGTNVYEDDEEDDEADQLNSDDGALFVRVKYILSEASGGHGDDLWAAARHVANIFADSTKCRQLLEPALQQVAGSMSIDAHNNNNNNPDHHPLLGRSLVELGAGAGVPSWIAMKCGARVVCTDQAIPNRIRCIAECAERNLRELREVREEGDNELALVYAEKARACPYDWGSSIDEILELLNESTSASTCTATNTDTDTDIDSSNLFDVVLAADCVYMPQFHSVLLDSIKMLLAEKGVALLPFALHGNTKDDTVWSIIDLAKEKGFQVEILDSQQLTPQGAYMESKRALVNMIRLSFR